MRGPLVDLVLLALVVAFFGVQQRRRTEAYFRFWLMGWALVVASMIVAQIMLEDPGAGTIQQSLSRVVLACGGLAFVFSFVAKQRKGRVSALQSTLVAVPIFFGLDIFLTHAHARVTLIAIIVAGELVAAALTWASMNGRRGWLFWLMMAACPLSGWAMIAAVLNGQTEIFLAIVPCEIFLFSGLLFSTMRRAGGRTIGAAGFFLWGFWYIVVALPWMPAGVVAIVYALWAIPKYLVAFGMTLKLFKKVNAEYEELNARHQRLYEQYRILFDSNPHPMAIYDVETTRFLAVNDAMVDSYGYTRTQFLGMSLGEVTGEALVVDGVRLLSPIGIAKRVGRHRKADGTTFDADVTGNDVKFEGRSARMLMILDITEREELNRELVWRAHHDALTGLPNRVMLEDRLTQWLTRCIREESMGAFLTVDIDHFKRVNDTYGHQAGDECLKVTAERLRSRVRQVDTIARTGGEEFTIVIGGLKTREGAEKVCAELLKLFETPVRIPGHEIQLTVSIGVALYPDDGCEVDILRRSSDQALYRAKRGGRNRAVFVPAQRPEQTADQARV